MAVAILATIGAVTLFTLSAIGVYSLIDRQ
jgi:hypothetical protein